MSITIDDAVIRASGKTEADVRCNIALALYAQQVLTRRQAADLAGLDEHTLLDLAEQRGIASYFDADDFRDDLRTLQELGRL